MERRFESRLDEMMGQAEVSPELLQGLLPRVSLFLEPFLQSLSGPEQKQHAAEYTTGLMSGLEHKTGEGIAYLYDQDRQGIQKFVGQMPWDHQPLFRTLAVQVGVELGEADGVIAFDPSAFPKKGDKSVGVAKQWCGRLGKVENCQVGVYMAYATRKEHAIVNTRLYLPKEWAKDHRRRKKPGCPSRSSFVLAINWRWRCCRNAEGTCRTRGSRGMTKWAAPLVFGWNCVPSASGTSWRSPRTH